jgi:predicted O-methyltransferase YrrM/SAM-dependent methyltransferase
MDLARLLPAELVEAAERHAMPLHLEERADAVPAMPAPGQPALVWAALERRTALLDALPLGDLSGKVCVDYGVGLAGFGARCPRLRRCGIAIGIDPSLGVTERHARIFGGAEASGGPRHIALVAGGDRLDLLDGSVDVFFAGDALERAEDVEAFLDDIHRVLKPDGWLLAIAANAGAYLFAQTGVRHGQSPERPGLMTHFDLRLLLAPRFDVSVAQGFNGALHPSLDFCVADLAVARAWAGQFADRPDLASETVILARRLSGYHPRRTVTRSWASDGVMQREGPWDLAPLYAGMSGWRGSGDEATLTIDFQGTDLVVLLWAHSWGGHASLEVDGTMHHLVDLYSEAPGFQRVHVRGLAPGPHALRIRGSGVKNPKSASTQVVFYKAIAYDGGEAARGEENMTDVDSNFRTRPARFGVVYTTPAHMLAPERVVLYGLVFASRPQRVLEIGTFRGGSALVIVAALDDVGVGTLVCVDPQPNIAPEHWAQIAHRATLFAEPSPDVLPKALEVAGGRFDFALIDGDHEYPGVVRDIEGVLPYLAPEAHLLFHDAHYFEVREAIDRMLCEHADCLTDCGMISTDGNPEGRSVNGKPIVWGGLRLLRYHQPR